MRLDGQHKAGADYFVRKPFSDDGETLEKCIQEVLAARRGIPEPEPIPAGPIANAVVFAGFIGRRV